MGDTVELIELAIYAALKLRKAGRNDDEIMAKVKAIKAEKPGDNQAVVDGLLAMAAANEQKIDTALEPSKDGSGAS